MQRVLSLSAPESSASSRVGMCTCLSSSNASSSRSDLLAGYDSGHVLLHDVRSSPHVHTLLAHGSTEEERGRMGGDELVEIEAVLAVSDEVVMYATASHVALVDIRRPGDPLTRNDLTRQTGGGIHGLALKPQQQATTTAASSSEQQRDAQRGNDARCQVAVASDYGGVVLVGVDVAKGKVDVGRGSRMKGGHANLCSSVSYLPWRPRELVSGGMDCTMARWDAGRGEAVCSWKLAGQDAAAGINPPFVHDISVQVCGNTHLVAAACGDGAIRMTQLGMARGSRPRPRDVTELVGVGGESPAHSAPASCVAFVSGGDAIVSGGTDRRLVVFQTPFTSSCTAGCVADVSHGRKVNAICPTVSSSGAVHIATADTSTSISVYELVRPA